MSLFSLSPSLSAFTHGFVLAAALIVAIGPQNVFIFQQGIAQPRLVRTVPTVLTAAIADTLLIGISVVGLSVVILRFAWLRTAMFAAGAIFLAYYGWALLRQPALAVDPDTESFLRTRQQIGFTASVSLLNPHALLDTIGVIGTNALAYGGPDRWYFAIGCVVVSWVAFSALALAGRLFESTKTGSRLIEYVNPASAIVMWLFAGWMVWQLLGMVLL